MIQKIHHIGIAVKSLDEALRFYSEILGLTVHKRATVEQQGARAGTTSVPRPTASTRSWPASRPRV